MKEQRLTNQLVETTVNEIREEYRLWGEQYIKGLETKEVCYQKMEAGIYLRFWKLIQDHNLKLCLCEANYPQFCIEFESFIDGNLY